MRRAAMVLGLGLLAGSAAAQERVGVRTGDHPGFGRLVFDWRRAPAYRVEQQGDRVVLRFQATDPIDLSGARRLPRNLLSATGGDGAIELVMRPGARLRHFRNGPKVALDFLDPARRPREGNAPPPASALPAAPARPVVPEAPPAVPVEAPPAASEAVPRPAATAHPAAPPLQEPPPGTAPLDARSLASRARPRPAPPSPESPPVASAAINLADPPPLRARLLQEAGQRPALRLAVGAGLGAAALRRGDQAMVVLETARPIDLGAVLRASDFPEIKAQQVAGATLITWRLAADQRLILRQEDQGWLVIPVPREQVPTAGGGTASAAIEQERLALPAARPSRVVVLSDPLTGLPLLVGLVAEAAAPRRVARSLTAFDLPETFLGVAVLARDDRVALRSGVDRFLVSVEGEAIATAGATFEDAASRPGMTRSFDLPSLTVPALQARLRGQQASIGAVPPLLRLAPRLAAAQTLVALGLPQEAQAMLRLAGQESPQSEHEAKLAFLEGVAALLGGRAEEAGGLDVPLPRSDEVLLWRALRRAMQGEPGGAASGLAATMPLLLSYPEGLRRRLLPNAVEALAEGGQSAAARRLLDELGEAPSLHLARALVEEAEGQVPEALEAYERAIAGRDRRTRARAIRRAVELRLRTGRLDAAGAARQLEQTLFAWRGDAQEIDARERLAALRGEAGDPRGALALLRETEALFPERAAALQDRLRHAFLRALEIEPPLGAVGLHDAYPELLPEGAEGVTALALLAERLSALDLRERAAEVLRRAMERLAAGESRAALGALLAERHLAGREAERALEALALSSAPRLPPALTERRSLLAAQAEAGRGNRQIAVEALTALGPAGDEALADLLAEARDFAGAAAALSRHLARLPAAEDWSESLQRTALRGAAFLVLAGDEAGLAAHRARYAPRVARPEMARAFEALTVDPVRGLSDLPRLGRELNLFRGLPQTLEPLRTAQRIAG